MGQHTENTWCDYTFKPWGKGNPRVRTSAANWKLPLKWNKIQFRQCGRCRWRGHTDCQGCGVVWSSMKPSRARVFCASLSDWLDDEVPIEWLADLLKLIHDTPNLDWLLLSKRPENWLPRMESIRDDLSLSLDSREFARQWIEDGERGLPQNIWCGTSIENQDCADKRIPELFKIPAKVRFLSVEPLLGPVEFSDVTNRSDAVLQLGKNSLDGIHWVICGSESGKNRRPMNAEWAISLKNQCDASGVKFFMKQLEVDGKVTGNIGLFPEELQRREFPK